MRCFWCVTHLTCGEIRKISITFWLKKKKSKDTGVSIKLIFMQNSHYLELYGNFIDPNLPMHFGHLIRVCTLCQHNIWAMNVYGKWHLTWFNCGYTHYIRSTVCLWDQLVKMYLSRWASRKNTDQPEHPCSLLNLPEEGFSPYLWAECPQRLWGCGYWSKFYLSQAPPHLINEIKVTDLEMLVKIFGQSSSMMSFMNAYMY